MLLRVRQAIKVSAGSIAKKATLSDGKSVLVADIKVGHVLAVRAGEMVLADGQVVTGQAVLDESALTGVRSVCVVIYTCVIYVCVCVCYVW